MRTCRASATQHIGVSSTVLGETPTHRLLLAVLRLNCVLRPSCAACVHASTAAASYTSHSTHHTNPRDENSLPPGCGPGSAPRHMWRAWTPPCARSSGCRRSS